MVNRDLRDPKLLGESLLEYVECWGRTVRYVCDTFPKALSVCPSYEANPGPLEKYGDPTKLPSTLPN